MVANTKAECTEAEERVLTHDRRVRTAHRAAARLLGEDWERYLVSLGALLHYADHASAELGDAYGFMQHVLRIVTADGHVSSSERSRLVQACESVWSALDSVFAQRDDVDLPAAVREKLGCESVRALLGEELRLGRPTHANIGDWLNVVGSWADAVGGAIGRLAGATLEVLLATEDHIARALRGELEAGEAPAPGRVPGRYATLVLGEERERQKRLGWWDRFQVADGFLPGAARFTVATALLVPALVLSGGAGAATVTVYNGLAVPVVVSIDGEEQTVMGHASSVVEPTANDDAVIETRTSDGRSIERFHADVGSTWSKYVYDVASAAPLVEWTASYGSAREVPQRPLGAPRFGISHADVLFREPPRSVSTSSSGGTTRDVLTAVEASVGAQLSFVTDPGERRAMIEAHARFDPSHDPNVLGWVEDVDDPRALIEARLQAEPRAVIWLRLEQDRLDHDAACARQRALAEAAPGDLDLAYLTTRCIDDRAARGRAFLEAHEAHPRQPWIAMAAGYELASRGLWDDALRAFEASRAPALAPLRAHLDVDVARIRRVRAPDPRAVPLVDLTEESTPLTLLLFTEGIGEPGEGLDSEMWPWRLFARGALSEAVDASQGPASAVLLRLAAASEGATEAITERAWSLPVEAGTDGGTVWPTIALAMREGRDPSPFIEQARTIYDDDAEPLLDLIERGAITDPSAIEGVLDQLVPVLRGEALVMGIVLNGASAPEQWRRTVRALLFVPERPFFR